MATYTRAGGLATDPKDDYASEVNDAMQKVIGRAWADAGYKSELIGNPQAAFAELGVHVAQLRALEVAVGDARQRNVMKRHHRASLQRITQY